MLGTKIDPHSLTREQQAHFIVSDEQDAYGAKLQRLSLIHISGMQRFVKDLNHVYTENPALYEVDDSWDGFKWLNVEDRAQSVFAFIRTNGEEFVVCAVNFTPVVRENYWIAMPREGMLERLLCSDETRYGGSGVVPEKKIETRRQALNGMEHSAVLTLPPLGAVYYKFTRCV